MKTLVIFFFIHIAAVNLFANEYWFQTNGPYGGSIFSICVLSTGDILCGTLGGGGIFRSASNGNSWNRTFTYPDFYAIESISQSSSGKIFATGYMPFPILSSTNNGLSWQGSDVPAYSRSVTVTPNGTIFAGTRYHGVWRSTDNGNNWSQSYSAGTEYCYVYNDNQGNVFASVDWGYVRTSDNGQTWQHINSMLISPAWTVTPSGTIFSGNYNGVYKSTNGGLNWTNVYNFGVIIWSLTCEPNGTIYCGGPYGTIYKSTNEGITWDKVFNLRPPGWNTFTGEALAYSNGYIYAGFGTIGMYRSSDHGNSWEKINEGILNSKITCMAVNQGNRVFAGTMDGIQLTTNGGGTWEHKGLQYSIINSIALKPNGDILVSTGSDTAIYKSSNNGNSWVKFSDINCYKVFTERLPYIFVSVSGGIKRSSNDGLTWDFFPINMNAIPELYFLPNGDILAGTLGIYRSTNNGANWIKQDSLILGNSQISLICGTPSGDLLASSDKLYKSTNNGYNWSVITDFGFKDLISTPSGYLLGVRTNWEGVMISFDSGFTWNFINEGLITKRPGMFCTDSAGNVYFGTDGSSVYKTDETLLKINNVQNSVPLGYFLSQNYPNPFNPVTNLRFGIPKAGVVKILIYDVVGRQVSELVNQDLAAGTYDFDFDAGGLSSGVYFYRLTADGFTDVKKMILVK